MRNIKNIVGERYGRLLVVERGPNDQRNRTTWRCKCDCGNEIFIKQTNLKSGNTNSCGCLRLERMQAKGEKSTSWKGGITHNAKGYTLVYAPDHEHSYDSGYVREHILVMTKHLGRPLLKNETVHHKNGIKTDNRIENLELWASSHPHGQRVEDLVKHAWEIIKLYDPDHKHV